MQVKQKLCVFLKQCRARALSERAVRVEEDFEASKSLGSLGQLRKKYTHTLYLSVSGLLFVRKIVSHN